MQTVWLLILAALAAQAPAARVKVRKSDKAVAVAVVNQTQAEQPKPDWSPPDEPEPWFHKHSYWYTHTETFEPVALVDNQYTQQFELKEDYRFLRTKKYKAWLEQWEDPYTGKEVRKKIDAKVFDLENYFFTMSGHAQAIFQNEQGTTLQEYTMFNPHYVNRYYTWRVVKAGEGEDQLRFTIQKRLYDDHCKYLGMFSCKPVLKIYVGAKGDKSTLIYYGVGDEDLGEPDFKFFHSEEEYKHNKKGWVAKVDHQKHDSDGEDHFKVKVKPGEDAGLLLLATVCLDKVSDDAGHDEDQNAHQFD